MSTVATSLTAIAARDPRAVTTDVAITVTHVTWKRVDMLPVVRASGSVVVVERRDSLFLPNSRADLRKC